jgi:hypothetical protein
MLPPGGAGGGPDVSPGAAADCALAALTRGPPASVAAVSARAMSVLGLMNVISDDVATSAVDLKFLSSLRQSRVRNFKSKTALETNGITSVLSIPKFAYGCAARLANFGIGTLVAVNYRGDAMNRC